MRFFFKLTYRILVILGATSSVFLIGGMFIDFNGVKKVETDRGFLVDERIVIPTSPFILQTKDKVVKKGVMSNYVIDCFSGISSFKIHGGIQFDYFLLLESYFYQEIFKKYTPREICLAGGVTPEF